VRERVVSDEARIAALFDEVAETHHRVYRITDGTDADWASWYADWLLNLSELPELIGGPPVRSHLVYALVQLDRDFTREAPGDPWPTYYARRLSDLLVADA
jgi:hypothetical protein